MRGINGRHLTRAPSLPGPRKKCARVVTAVLRVAHLITDTEAEGPGRRFAVWVQGCTLRCPGCCNPELFAHGKGGRLVEPGALAREVLETPDVEGLSVLGGEPLEQAGPLAELCRAVQAGGLSVMVYSGYTLEELRARQDAHVDAVLSATDLLLDGRYEANLPEPRRRWVGSSNQRLHFLTARYQPEDPRFTRPNTVELRLTRAGLTVNGWPQGADRLRR